MTPPAGRENDARSDAALARLAREGDTAALAVLLERHQARVFRMCLRVTGDEEAALEAAQDAMLRAVRAIRTFDERAQFTTWITRIAINACYSRARSEKLRRHISLDAAPGSNQTPSRTATSGTPAASGSGGSGGGGGAGGGGGGENRGTLGAGLTSREQIAHQRVEGEENRARVLEALSTLDIDSRTILILRDGRDLDYEQIAEILGVAIGTVKSRLFRARQALRDALERPGNP